MNTAARQPGSGAAANPISDDAVSPMQLWALGLDLSAVIAAKEEPSAEIAVAAAFLQCAHREPAVRAYMVEGMAADLGTDLAERQGDLSFAALKVLQTERLLGRVRRIRNEVVWPAGERI